MKRSVKIKISIIFILIISVAVLMLIINYKTNYNWRYKELIEKLTDVPNKEYIVRTNLFSGRGPYSGISVNVSDKGLSNNEIYQMGYDIAEKIDQYIYHGMKQTLSIHFGEMYLSVFNSDITIGINCTRYTKIGDREPKCYTWTFEKYPSKETEEKITPIIYPDEE